MDSGVLSSSGNLRSSSFWQKWGANIHCSVLAMLILKFLLEVSMETWSRQQDIQSGVQEKSPS